jgi:hypothetical protein
VTIDLLERVVPIPAPESHPVTDRPVRARASLPWFALAGIVAIGAALRSRGFTSFGLWRDDAWVAMLSRVGIGKAAHMGVTAPGFYLLERSWILLHPGSTWWDQIPPFTLGVACIPALFLLCRYFKLETWICLFSALIVSLSPICVIYSTRLKEYQSDFLLACALLAAAEAARRRLTPRRLGTLVAISVVAFFLSAATMEIIGGVWLSLIILAAVEHRRTTRVLGAAAAAAALCLVPFTLFYRHIPPPDKVGWDGFYILPHSLGTLLSSTHFVLFNLYAKMIGTSGTYALENFLVFWGVTGLVLVGATRSRAMLGPALVAATALIACGLGIVPLGAGRVDEVLYPGLLLLMGAGLHRIGRAVTLLVPDATLRHGLAAVLGVCAAGSLVIGSASFDPVYPATDTQALAAQISHNMRPGDHVVVDELMRYPWALYEDRHLDVKFGQDWAAGFTVVSTQPSVFIAPSEVYEGGSHPVAWAAAMAGYTRLWFVETPPLQLSPLYAALRRDGWRPVRVLHATGCAAILLQRS